MIKMREAKVAFNEVIAECYLLIYNKKALPSGKASI
jgi:hypothetical protein